jgi:hypothetical protein
VRPLGRGLVQRHSLTLIESKRIPDRTNGAPVLGSHDLPAAGGWIGRSLDPGVAILSRLGWQALD